MNRKSIYRIVQRLYTFCLLVGLVLVLSSCHSQKFDYESSQVQLNTDLLDILDLMMDKGNYSDTVTVPYDRVALAIDYSTSNVVVEAVQFQVLNGFKDDEWQYDMTGCFDVEGQLKCREERGMFSSEEKEDEILLIWAFDIFSQIDVNKIVTDLKQHNQVISLENTIVQGHFAYPSDIEEMQERFDTVVFYHDDEYDYDNTYSPSDMMLEIRVDFFGDGKGFTYIVYYEIDS